MQSRHLSGHRHRPPDCNASNRVFCNPFPHQRSFALRSSEPKSNAAFHQFLQKLLKVTASRQDCLFISQEWCFLTKLKCSILPKNCTFAWTAEVAMWQQFPLLYPKQWPKWTSSDLSKRLAYHLRLLEVNLLVRVTMLLWCTIRSWSMTSWRQWLLLLQKNWQIRRIRHLLYLKGEQ